MREQRETVVVSGPRLTLPAHGETLILGRDPDCDLVIPHPSVSRRHAQVVRTADQSWLLRDLDSSNGTYYDGQRVAELRLARDTVISVGSPTGLQVRLCTPAPAAVGPDAEPERRGLVVEGLGVRRGGKDLLRDVDLVIAPGELVAVIGPSGAGKSTLVSALTGVQRPTSGRVLLDGYDVHDAFEAVRDNIGFVPQDDVLHPQLTVEQCLRYAAALRLSPGTDQATQRAAVARVVDQLDLVGHEHKRIHLLSGGQRKRVGTALELLNEPALLVLDEPTSGLDPLTERRVMDVLARLAGAGHVVLVVTHSPLAVEACSSAVVVAQGELVYAGTVEGLPAHFRARTLGTVFAQVGEAGGRWAQHWRDVVTSLLAPAPAPALDPPPPRQLSRGERWRQVRTLVRRNTALLLADPANLAMLLLGAPLLGALVRLLGSKGLAIGKPVPEAINVLLAAALCVVWLGTFDAVREIVKERPVLERERRSGLSVWAYVQAKILVLGGLVTLQVVAFTAVLLAGRPLPAWRLVPGPGVELGLGLAVAGWCAVAVALLVSALASTSDKALALAPLLVVPQLVLAGALADIHSTPWLDLPTRLVTARWALSAASASVDLPAVEGHLVDRPEEWGGSTGTWLLDLSWLVALTVLTVGVLTAVLARSRARER